MGKKQTHLLPFYLLLLFFFAKIPFSLASVYDYTITVIDETGQPMIGVYVFTDDNQKVAGVTDIDGKIVVDNMKYNYAVNFQYIGYKDLRLQWYEIRNKSGIVRMELEPTAIQEIVVIGRRDDLPEVVPYQIDKIDKKDIALTNPQSTADALRDHGGVFVQKSQAGGGSPVLRGFEANRVLLVVDGVRMNNAIYRNGHLQNAITVDPSMLERIEVIYGPGSLMYGSDALGGVVHFRSRDPQLHFTNTKGNPLQGNAYTRFSSANNEGTFHLDLNYGTKKWASLTSFSYSRFGELRAGSNRPDGYEHFGQRRYYLERKNGIDQLILNAFVDTSGLRNDTITYYDVQEGTGFSQWDMMQKVRFQPNDNLYFIGNLQFSSSTDVPRYDRLIELTDESNPRSLRFSEWHYGPQKRFLASLKTRLLKRNRFFDKGTIIASFQKIDEDRLSRRRDRHATSFNLEDIFVYALTGDFDKQVGNNEQLTMTYGFDLNHNQVNSRSGTKDKDNGLLNFTEPTRYPSGGSSMTSTGLYATARWVSRDSVLNFDAGLRFSQVDLLAVFSDTIIQWPQAYRDGITSTNRAMTYGFGATVKTKDQWQFRLLGASAFRAPNIDDFGKIRAKGGRTTIPNPTLRPEYSWNTEFTIAKEIGNHTKDGGSAFYISATGFYTFLRDAMVRMDFPNPDGTNKLVVDGELHTTQSLVNAENAFVYGFSGNIRWDIGKYFTLKSGINYTHGRQTYRVNTPDPPVMLDTLVPLSHIPPLYGQSSLQFQNDRWTIAFVMHYQGAKPVEEYNINDIDLNDDGTIREVDRFGSSDNLDLGYYRLVDGEREYVGTLAWQTYNLYTSYRFNNKWTLNLAMENIADLHYRPFSSGVSGPGRNIIATLRMKF